MWSPSVVELQKRVERALQLSDAPEKRAPKYEPPVLVQDRSLESLDKSIGPGMSRLRARMPDPEPGQAGVKRALEFFAAIRQHAAQRPLGARVDRQHDLLEKRQHRGRRDLARLHARPAIRARRITRRNLPDLTDALEPAHVERVERQQIAGPRRPDVSGDATPDALGDHARDGRGLMLHRRQPRLATTQPVPPQ